MSRRFTLHGSRLLPLAVVAAAGILSGACRQDMHQAPRYDPLEESAVFPGGAASQPLIEGTVARGHLDDDDLLYTGKVNGQFADAYPFEITKADLDRGEQRFNIYCSPCHGRTGEGNGMVVQRGFRQAANYHQDRLRQEPAGQLFDTITNGFGAMLDYKAQIQPEDRWRIVAYLRALQLTHHATAADVPADHMKDLAAPATAAAEGKSGETK
jgi:mono/diheme cytochrome c family protein